MWPKVHGVPNLYGSLGRAGIMKTFTSVLPPAIPCIVDIHLILLKQSALRGQQPALTLFTKSQQHQDFRRLAANYRQIKVEKPSVPLIHVWQNTKRVASTGEEPHSAVSELQFS